MATRMYVCESVEHPSTLLAGLNQQRLQGLLCDVTVRVQGHLFKAHTNVLASAMGYFRDLFFNQSKHKKEGIIEIPVIVNSMGFAKVLDFIYTSQLCLSQSSVMQVLCSACFLQIPYVVEKCQEFIVTHGHVPLSNNLAITDLSTNGQDSNQGCELINTPPSPNQQQNQVKTEERMDGMHADQTNSVGSALSPQDDRNSDNKVKLEDNYNEIKNGIFAYNDEIMQSENSASKALLSISQNVVNRFGNGQTVNSGSLKTLLRSENLLNGSDQIDHDSLAEYFARNGGSNPGVFTSTNSYFKNMDDKDIQSTPNKSTFSAKKTEKNPKPSVNQDGDMTTSSAHYLLAMKKEKPKKEYKCEYCSKMFGRQQHLKRHILTHTGERPYPCTMCEKRFRRSEHLKHHLAKHQTANGETDAVVMPGRKRQRKNTPVSLDAYSMSKMMLTYNQSNSPSQSTTIPTESFVLSTSLTSSGISSGKTINTISDKLAHAQSNGVSNSSYTTITTFKQDNNTFEFNTATEAAPSPSQNSDSMVINLSNKADSNSVLSVSPSETFKESEQENNDPEERQSDMKTDSVADKTLNNLVVLNQEENELNDMKDNIENMQSENETTQVSSQSVMSSFAGSEVMTSDLKNLFAAME